jgi:hypothetical protein
VHDAGGGDLSDDEGDYVSHDDGRSRTKTKTRRRRKGRDVDEDPVGRLRPSFKRLASTTLGRPDAKRRQFSVSPPGEEGGEVGGGVGAMDQGMLGIGLAAAGGVEAGGGGTGFAPGALGMH